MTRKKRSDNDFVYIFGEYVGVIMKVKSLVDMKILWALVTEAEYNTNKIYLTSLLRKELSDMLCIKSSNMSTGIRRLKEIGIIEGNQGLYTINPSYIWRGDLDQRPQVIYGYGA